MTLTHPNPWTASDIIEATRGTLLSEGSVHAFAGICIDSRAIMPGDCFLAIRGETHDGHSFIPEVLKKGVKGLIIQSGQAYEIEVTGQETPSVLCIGVPDTLAALGALAGYHRKRSDVSVVAITGSNGKTSTRTMAAAVLSKRFHVLSPEGNFNNEVGLPLTLLRLNSSHEWAVLELGMNHPGEIGRLGEICRPDIGLITNIGPAHLEGLGSLEGVMHAKGELIEKVKPGGKILLNADDPMTENLMQKTAATPLLFGSSADADIRATELSAHPAGVSFTLHIGQEAIRVNLRVPGTFMSINALAAAAVGHAVGIPIAEIAAALESFAPIKGRMNLYRTGGGFNIIDDTYNANPGSVKAALTALKGLKKEHRGLVVLGDMLELGNASWDLHREIGVFAARAGVSRLYVTGAFADAVVQGAQQGGMAPVNTFVGDKEAIFADLVRHFNPGDWLLIKGSRGMRMETLVKALMDELNKGQS